jgi:hypothetical protein
VLEIEWVEVVVYYMEDIIVEVELILVVEKKWLLD